MYESEPIYDKNYGLLKYDNVVCTPHLGYVELNGYELYFGKAFENVVHYINGNATNIANPETLKKNETLAAKRWFRPKGERWKRLLN